MQAKFKERYRPLIPYLKKKPASDLFIQTRLGQPSTTFLETLGAILTRIVIMAYSPQHQKFEISDNVSLSLGRLSEVLPYTSIHGTLRYYTLSLLTVAVSYDIRTVSVPTSWSKSSITVRYDFGVRQTSKKGKKGRKKKKTPGFTWFFFISSENQPLYIIITYLVVVAKTLMIRAPFIMHTVSS